MGLAYYLPEWFFNYEVVLGLLYAIILFIVSRFAFKITYLTDHKQTGYLGIGLFLLSISYFIESILNGFILSGKDLIGVLDVNAINANTHIILFTIAFSLLTFMTFNIENRKILIYTLSLSLFAIYLSADNAYSFYVVTTVMLYFICLHFLQGHFRKKSLNSLLISLSFLSLFISNFLFLILPNKGGSYVGGHIFELISYSLILLNFILVNKQWRKKETI